MQGQNRNKPYERQKEPGTPFRESGSARSWRDSNPRAQEGKRISSAPRYDRFDTTPYLSITNHIIMFLVRQVKVVVFHTNSVYYMRITGQPVRTIRQLMNGCGWTVNTTE